MSDSNSQAEALMIVDAISEKIHLIRGQKVMLDSDLAEIYQVETRVLKQAVRRNRQRFPEDFMFELTADEVASVDRSRSQSVILNQDKARRGGNFKYLPFVFTEHGAVMLASVLNSQTAVAASIAVVRAFVKLRGLLAVHKELLERLQALEETSEKHEENFAVVSQLLRQVIRDPKYLKRKIGFIDEGYGDE